MSFTVSKKVIIIACAETLGFFRRPALHVAGQEEVGVLVCHLLFPHHLRQHQPRVRPGLFSLCEWDGSGRVACLGHRMLCEHELRRQGPMQPKQETEENGERDVVWAVSRAGRNVHGESGQKLPASRPTRPPPITSPWVPIRPPRAQIRPHLGTNRPCWAQTRPRGFDDVLSLACAVAGHINESYKPYGKKSSGQHFRVHSMFVHLFSSICYQTHTHHTPLQHHTRQV